MARKRNPRRVIMEAFHTLAGEARQWRNRWDTPSYAYDRDSNARRERRPDEYPENNAQAFYQTGAYLDSLIADLMVLRQFVGEQEAACRARTNA